MKVYMTKRNAKWNEGRGPMVNDKCFLHLDDAVQYINAQPEIMGTFDETGQNLGGWTIEEFEVIDYDIIKEQVKVELEKEVALNKLSARERTILGL